MKTDLILLHGALGSNIQFNRLLPTLTPHFTVHAVDFPGHGSDLTDTDYSIRLFSDFLNNFAQTNSLQNPNIFGYSMGGYVALKWASLQPDYKGTIITLGTKFDWNEDSAAREVKMLNPDKIEEKVPQFADRLRQLHGEDRWHNVVTKTAKMMEAMGAQPPLTEENLSLISSPVHIGIGRLDKMVTKDESEAVGQMLSNATCTVLDDFPHPLEQVDNSRLSDWIISLLK